MKINSFLICFFFSLKAFSLIGLEPLEKLMLEKNLQIKSLKEEIESKKSLLKVSYASYYPQFNAVNTWEESKINDPLLQENGGSFYLESKINLFHGFKDQYFTKQKELELEISNLDFLKLQSNLKVELVEILAEMIYLHKLQEILIFEEKTTAEHTKMAAKKTAAGLNSTVDNLEFELRNQEIKIENKQIEIAHKNAHQKLINFFGEDIADDFLDNIQFEGLNELAGVPPFEPNLNPSIKKANLLTEVLNLERKAIKSDFLPTVDFNYKIGKITPSHDAELEFNENKYGVQINFPIFSGFETRNRLMSSEHQSQSLRLQASQTSISLLSNYKILSNSITELQELHRINENRLNVSKKYFEMTTAEYRRGIKNSPDLVTATERWFSSQKRKYEILKDLEIAKVKIENLN